MLKIRGFVEGKDEEVWVRIQNEAYREYDDFRPIPWKTWKSGRRAQTSTPLEWSYLDDKPVGYVGAGIDSKFIEHQGIKRGWIMDIGVLKPHRRRGIGTALMQQGMEFLKSREMTEVDIDVDDTNPTRAIALYKKVGFKIVHKDLTYLKKID